MMMHIMDLGVSDPNEGGNVAAEIEQGVKLDCSLCSTKVDENLRKVGVDPPIAALVGIGQRTTRDPTPKAQMAELVRNCAETCLDISRYMCHS